MSHSHLPYRNPEENVCNPEDKTIDLNTWSLVSFVGYDTNPQTTN